MASRWEDAYKSSELYAREQRRKEAVQRLVAVAVELHLTWAEFEDAMNGVKRAAYCSLSPEDRDSASDK